MRRASEPLRGRFYRHQKDCARLHRGNNADGIIQCIFVHFAVVLQNFTVIDAMMRNATVHLMPESGIIDVENLSPTHVLVVGEYVLQGHSVEPQFKVKDVKAVRSSYNFMRVTWLALL